MKLSLYQIEQEYMILTQSIIDNEGEITPEIAAQLAINSEDLQTKSSNYGLVIRQLEGENDLIENEIKRLQGLKKSREKATERLKESIATAMKLYEVEEIKTPLLKISFRKSESVEVEDMALLDPKFITTKVTTIPDKTAIKEAIKAGETVTGAILKQNKNIQFR